MLRKLLEHFTLKLGSRSSCEGRWSRLLSTATSTSDLLAWQRANNLKGIESQRARKALRPKASGRNRFDANSQKQRQIRKATKERKENKTHNLAVRDEIRIRRWRADAESAAVEPPVQQQNEAVPT
ncbi:hypothetical protein WJX74_004448 [Apatococcus lobatus]|uniref:Uncharacterized protein n=2 Tax=Apatococcus TaxID=904362 RepID=A0AAW1T1V5_9CHLO